MAEYVKLEKEVYDTIRAKPFTKIPSKPTWAQKELMLEESKEIALDCNVSYTWAGDYGLLAEIEGTAQYLATTGNNYVTPTQPADIDPEILINGTTQVRVKVLQERTIVSKRDWAVVKGFRKGVCDNMRECLQARYYEQLYEPVFKYKRLTPRDYISHLESKWVILDELQIEEMTKNYKRGWETDEHFTTFAYRLDREQAALLKDSIIISDADKKQHMMVEVWARDLFDRAVMIKWNDRTPAQKSYAHAVTYFTKELRSIENFEASGGGASKKQGFESANVVAEIQTACVNQLKENREDREKERHELRHEMATEFAGAIAEQREEIESLRGVLASIENKLIRAPATPIRRPKPRVEESDSDTEVETPPKKKKKSRREKLEAKKKKQKAERKSERRPAPRSTTAPVYKEGEAFEPGMEWDDVPGNQKVAFLKARREFAKSGTAEAKEYKIKSLRKQLELAEKE